MLIGARGTRERLVQRRRQPVAAKAGQAPLNGEPVGLGPQEHHIDDLTTDDVALDARARSRLPTRHGVPSLSHSDLRGVPHPAARGRKTGHGDELVAPGGHRRLELRAVSQGRRAVLNFIEEAGPPGGRRVDGHSDRPPDDVRLDLERKVRRAGTEILRRRRGVALVDPGRRRTGEYGPSFHPHE